MACKRDKFIDLIEYYESLGITVKLGKTKARGNKGIFIAKRGRDFRIDISKSIDDNSVLATLLHEFAHYVHYCYDNELSSLKFIFDELSDEEMEELLSVTVYKVPRNSAYTLINLKTSLTNEIKTLADSIKDFYPEFKITGSYFPIEDNMSYPLKYLLKYDNFIYNKKKYSINNALNDFKTLSKPQLNYLILKSKRRCLARVNSRISKLNQYYNAPTELWARFFELFFTEPCKAESLAPSLSRKFKTAMEVRRIKEISKLNEILKNIY